MTTNIGEFTIAINEFTRERIPEEHRRFTMKIALELLRGIVLSSPVGNPALWKGRAPPGYVGGAFRGNWQVSLGLPASGALDEIDRSGGPTIARGLSVVAGVAPFQTIWLQNNLPYALRIEQGWSTQAPTGVVETNLIRVSSRFRVSD